MAEALSARTSHARELFAPLAPSYDRYANLLSFGQDPRWRRFLVSRIEAGPDDIVLDVATGTGAVAAELQRTKGCAVIGVDQSAEMLAVARQRLAGTGIQLVEASAGHLPLDETSFDALTFTYLLRYVDDPAATLRELARVVRPGGTVASLEFGVPRAPVPHGLWRAYVDVGLPLASRLIAPGWAEVGRFLGRNIREFYEKWPLDRLLAAWNDAGIREIQGRSLSFGGGVVIWGRRK